MKICSLMLASTLLLLYTTDYATTKTDIILFKFHIFPVEMQFQKLDMKWQNGVFENSKEPEINSSKLFH